MVSIFAKARFCRGNTQVHLQFFCKSNFSRHRKAELLRKRIALVLQAKFRFMGCLVKVNALVLGNIALSLSSQLIALVFTKQAIYREIFSKYIFVKIFVNFQKILAAHQNTFRKVLESSQKYVVKSYASKVSGFYRSNHRMCSVKIGFLERCSQNLQ